MTRGDACLCISAHGEPMKIQDHIIMVQRQDTQAGTQTSRQLVLEKYATDKSVQNCKEGVDNHRG